MKKQTEDYLTSVIDAIGRTPGIHYKELAESCGKENLSMVLYALKHGVDGKVIVNGVEDPHGQGRSVDISRYTLVEKSKADFDSDLRKIIEHWRLNNLN
ncbi:MAG: hypothetical protein ABH840_00495 [Nanoarchaeota archaeon]